MAEIKNYKVAASPHKLDSSNTRRIMADVLIAMVPCLVCGVVFYGLYALMLVAVCVATCFVSEQIYNLVRKKPYTFDLSCVVTGLILGLNLPPRAPWYIPIIGGVFAIIIVKMLFGGLGKNFANPAATARVFLLLAYSSLMTKYVGADVSNMLAGDVTTGATYLSGGVAAFKDSFWGVSGYWGYVLQLLFGYIGGSIGETCKVAILAGGVYLTARRVIDWRIPVVYLLTAAVMVLVCYQSASEILLQLLSGGLMFGAVFMATDYATSPKWRYNRILYAIGLGIITMLIRRFGSYPEGTSLAILIMNLLVPIMDKFILPVRFGELTKSGKIKPQIMQWTMRGICIALVAALVVSTPIVYAAERRRPQEQELPVQYNYIQTMSVDALGNYYFDVKGSLKFDGSDYVQELEYSITLGDGVVQEIEPIKQSTMGYVAEESLFEGKTFAEISALSDLSTDSQTSATRTNTALKGMIEECFIASDAHAGAEALYGGYSYIKGAAQSALFGGNAFLVEGVADLKEYNYQQPLLFYVVIKDEKAEKIVPLKQSTMGYVAELSLFEGKTFAEISALSDLSTDSQTSATHTNASLRAMILECFEVLGGGAA